MGAFVLLRLSRISCATATENGRATWFPVGLDHGGNMKSLKQIALAFLVCSSLLAMAACGAAPTGTSVAALPMATPTVAELLTLTATVTPTWTPTAPPPLTPTPTATRTPTHTSTPMVTPTATPTPTPTIQIDVEGVGAVTTQEKATIDNAVSAFRETLGMDESQKVELSVTTIKMTDGETVDVIVAGDGYPLATRHQGGTWNSRATLADLFAANGILFGFTYDMKNNPFSQIVRPPDDLVGESSRIVTPEDTFYQSFTFYNNQVDWTKIDEYLAFLKKYNLVSGPPHLYWAGNDHTSQDTTELVSRATQIVEHCKGSIHVWTINELFSDNGTPRNVNTLTNAKAVIEAIRKADPTARIIVNDYGMDAGLPQKDKPLFDLVKQFMGDGTLQNGDMIGYQGHNGILYSSTPEQFADWFSKYAELGLNLRITEADVFDVTSLTPANETKKAGMMLMYYRAGKLLEERYGRKVLDALVVWGSTNNSSWLIYLGRAGEYPLLLDDKGDPFLSWYLIAKALLSDLPVK